MNSYEMSIQLEPALEHIIEEISICLTRDYHITATYPDIIENAVLTLYFELQQNHKKI
jgi:hypothetical protein